MGGISFVELLILYELWAGERLVLEKAHPRYLRPGCLISVSAVPFGPGIDIWRSCRFIGAMMRSLCMLSGGLGRFVPCSIGANHCRLRYLVGRGVVMDSLLVLRRGTLIEDDERVVSRAIAWKHPPASLYIMCELSYHSHTVHLIAPS